LLRGDSIERDKVCTRVHTFLGTQVSSAQLSLRASDKSSSGRLLCFHREVCDSWSEKSQNGMCLISAGKFEIGSMGGDSNELPVLEIEFSMYWMQKHPVTEYKGYIAVTKRGGDKFRAMFKGCGAGALWQAVEEKRDRGRWELELMLPGSCRDSTGRTCVIIRLNSSPCPNCARAFGRHEIWNAHWSLGLRGGTSQRANDSTGLFRAGKRSRALRHGWPGVGVGRGSQSQQPR
jgi:hypothetical protein